MRGQTFSVSPLNQLVVAGREGECPFFWNLPEPVQCPKWARGCQRGDLDDDSYWDFVFRQRMTAMGGRKQSIHVAVASLPDRMLGESIDDIPKAAAPLCQVPAPAVGQKRPSRSQRANVWKGSQAAGPHCHPKGSGPHIVRTLRQTGMTSFCLLNFCNSWAEVFLRRDDRNHQRMSGADGCSAAASPLLGTNHRRNNTPPSQPVPSAIKMVAKP